MGAGHAVAQEKTLRLGVTRGAEPFSYADGNGNPAGYSVDLCQRIAKAALAHGLYADSTHVWVTVGERFNRLYQGDIDLLCESTTVTLERIRHIDFTLQTFLTGASFVFLADAAPLTLEDIGSGPVSVVERTTTLDLVKHLLPNAKATEVPDDRDAINRLAAREVRAHFGDREVLLSLRDEAASQTPPVRLRVSDRYLSFEPYALGVRPDAPDTPCPERRRLLWLANQTLVGLYKKDKDGIAQLFHTHFPGHTMSPALKQMFRLQSLPEGESIDYVCGGNT